MEVYFTSPTIGKVYGSVYTEDHKTYYFKGKNVLISIELCRNSSGWGLPERTLVARSSGAGNWFAD